VTHADDASRQLTHRILKKIEENFI